MKRPFHNSYSSATSEKTATLFKLECLALHLSSRTGALKTSQENPLSHFELGKCERADILHSTKSLSYISCTHVTMEILTLTTTNLTWAQIVLKGNTSCCKNCFVVVVEGIYIYCLLSWQAQWSWAPLALTNRCGVFLGNFTNERNSRFRRLFVRVDGLAETTAFLEIWLRLFYVTQGFPPRNSSLTFSFKM